MLASLFRFGLLVLRVAPPLLWWVLGGLAFSALNNLLYQEFWPNTPLARPVFISLLLACLTLLPWLGARIAWALADAVKSYFWQALWRFTAIAGYAGAALAVAGGLVAQDIMWYEWIFTRLGR